MSQLRVPEQTFWTALENDAVLKQVTSDGCQAAPAMAGSERLSTAASDDAAATITNEPVRSVTAKIERFMTCLLLEERRSVPRLYRFKKKRTKSYAV
jgi:hypothetical protein